MKDIPGFNGKYQVSRCGVVVGPRGRELKPRRDKDGYHRLNMMHPEFGRSTFLIHRLVMLTFSGETPENHFIDHIDRSKTNNLIGNLRFVTSPQNGWNSIGRIGSSGYIGVAKSGRKWVARISVGNKRLTLGLFKLAIDAAKARDRKAIELHGEYAALNFPTHFQLSHKEYQS